MSNTNPFAVIAADVQAAIAAILAGLKWFATEAKAVIGWVDTRVPGAQQALATLFQTADDAATQLEQHAAAGFSDLVSGAVDQAGTTILNHLSRSGLDLTTKKILSAADVATVTAAHSIATNAITVATAKLLSTSHQVATAAQAANAAAPAPQTQPHA
jgi:hypothetical protein